MSRACNLHEVITGKLFVLNSTCGWSPKAFKNGGPAPYTDLITMRPATSPSHLLADDPPQPPFPLPPSYHTHYSHLKRVAPGLLMSSWKSTIYPSVCARFPPLRCQHTCTLTRAHFAKCHLPHPHFSHVLIPRPRERTAGRHHRSFLPHYHSNHHKHSPSAVEDAVQNDRTRVPVTLQILPKHEYARVSFLPTYQFVQSQDTSIISPLLTRHSHSNHS